MAGDVGDAFADALQVAITLGVEHVETQTVGDGDNLDSDVDLYEVSLQAGQTLSADVDAEFLDDGSSLSTLDSHLRIFDSLGSELSSDYDNYDPDTQLWGLDSALTFTASSTGTYYVGVSGYGNEYYAPTIGGSGYGGSTGDYELQLSILPPSPEIVVYEDDGYGGYGYELSDGGSFDFGTAAVGAPVAKSFVVENWGAGELTLDFANISLPDGFGLSDPSPSSVVVSPASSTTFSIEFSADSAGTYSGELSLPTNDGDENPFDFSVSATAAESDPPGDVLAGAQLLSPTVGVEQELSETIGNGLYGEKDVDFYRIDLVADQVLQVDIDAEYLDDGSSLSSLDSHVRIFDSYGYEVSYSYDDYDPDDVSDYSRYAGSVGDYLLQLEIISDPTEDPTAGTPEISVWADANGYELNDGSGLVDFGQADVGVPVVHTFTINNSGDAELTLDSESLVVPAGFSITSLFSEVVSAGD